MEEKLAKTLKTRMAEILSPSQLEAFDRILDEVMRSVGQEADNADVINRFISAKLMEGCSKRTAQYYLSTLMHFGGHIGTDILCATPEQVRDYLAAYQRLNGCSNVTLDTIRRILSSLYGWLEAEDLVVKSPMRRIHRIKAPLVIKPAFSDEQIEVIRKDVSGNARDLAAVDLLLSSGIRISELIRLDRSSINLEERTCVVLGKGAKQRETYFDVRTKIELEQYLKGRTDKGEALFVTRRRQRGKDVFARVSVNAMEKMIRKVGKRTGISDVHPHRFRRTMATRAIDKGMPIEQVQVLLGHSKIDTTLRYARVRQTNVRIAHQRYIC